MICITEDLVKHDTTIYAIVGSISHAIAFSICHVVCKGILHKNVYAFLPCGMLLQDHYKLLFKIFEGQK